MTRFVAGAVPMLHAWIVLSTTSPPMTTRGCTSFTICTFGAGHDVSRLALICPAGLWDDEHPIADLFAAMPYEMPALLFHDAEAGAAMLTAGRDVSDPNFLQTYLVTNARQLGMAGRILFPIPERGLAGRMHRIRARTIIIWGDSDRLIPPVYAHGFKKGILGAELVSIPEAGHMVTLERPKAVAEAISRLG